MVTADKKADGTVAWTMLAYLFRVYFKSRPWPAIGALSYAIRRIAHWRKIFKSLLSEHKRLASETSDSAAP